MVRSTESATTRREFLIRSAATAAGAFLSIGLPPLASSIASAQPMAGFTPSIWFTLTPDEKSDDAYREGGDGPTHRHSTSPNHRRGAEVKWEDVVSTRRSKASRTLQIYGLAYTVIDGSVTHRVRIAYRVQCRGPHGAD